MVLYSLIFFQVTILDKENRKTYYIIVYSDSQQMQKKKKLSKFILDLKCPMTGNIFATRQHENINKRANTNTDKC